MNNPADLFISTDKNKLDIKVIHAFLTKSYWAEGRTVEEVKTTIANSFCFGLFLKNEQIGFARILSDGVVFAYLMDVFILEKHRGNGFSKILLKEIFSHSDFANVQKWLLGTRDAHGLYKQFGFTELSYPERLMEWIKNKK